MQISSKIESTHLMENKIDAEANQAPIAENMDTMITSRTFIVPVTAEIDTSED